MEEVTYRTLGGRGVSRYEEKKSVFLGYAAPCKTEQEALSFIRKIKEENSDARHNVYAYMIAQNNLCRYTDDGEPQGTAGIPVLDIIRKNDFCDACIVVTRYFGGILLGTGGLLRAYTHAAKLAVDAAKIVTYLPYVTFSADCTYAQYQLLLSELSSFDAITDDTLFTDRVRLLGGVEAKQFEAFCVRVRDLTGGKCTVKKTGERFDCRKS